MADEKTIYYFVDERSKKIIRDDENGNVPMEGGGMGRYEGREYLTKSLERLYSKHGTHFASYDEWLSGILENEFAQRIAGFAVRVATDEDREDFGKELEVIEAMDEFREAPLVMKETQLKAQVVAARWFSKNVKSPEDADAFFVLHKLNAFSFSSWLTAAEDQAKKEKNSWRVSDESLRALFEYWEKKNVVLKGDAHTKAMNTKAYTALKQRVEAM